MALDHLRRNNLIRQYLHRFDERQWPEVVKLTVIFGIHNMKLNEREMQLLTIDKLSSLCAQASAAVSIQEALPALEKTLEELQSKISALKTEIGNNPAETSHSIPPPQFNIDTLMSNMDQDAPQLVKVLSKVRQLNNTKPEFRSQYSRQTVRGLQDEMGSVQQALSGAANESALRALRSSKPKWKERPPPRLAYSFFPDSKPQNDVTNDLVCSRFVDVPASFRDIRKSAAQQSEERGEDTIPVKEIPMRSKLNKGRTNASRQKVPSYLQNVRSRIKERVHQDRIAAAEHRKRIRRSIYQAVADDYPVHGSNSKSAAPKRETESSSVLQITDAFLKNLLMEPFAGLSKDHDEIGVLRQPQKTARYESDLRSAPESVDELSNALRSWVNNNDDALRPVTTLQNSMEDTIASLKRLNDESSSLGPVQSASAFDFKEDLQMPFEGQNPPEWDFSNTVFD